MSRPHPECGNIALFFPLCVWQCCSHRVAHQHRQPHHRATCSPHSQRGSTRKVLFLIIFGCEIWRFTQGLKMIDNSTYIIGIYHSAEKADYIPPTVWGCCLIHAKGMPRPHFGIRQKIGFPHLSCTPKLTPFSPGMEEHKTTFFAVNY